MEYKRCLLPVKIASAPAPPALVHLHRAPEDKEGLGAGVFYCLPMLLAPGSLKAFGITVVFPCGPSVMDTCGGC